MAIREFLLVSKAFSRLVDWLGFTAAALGMGDRTLPRVLDRIGPRTFVVRSLVVALGLGQSTSSLLLRFLVAWFGLLEIFEILHVDVAADFTLGAVERLLVIVGEAVGIGFVHIDEEGRRDLSVLSSRRHEWILIGLLLRQLSRVDRNHLAEQLLLECELLLFRVEV